jgi:hypothetical protein
MPRKTRRATEGGFLPLVLALGSAILPHVAGFVAKKVFGNGKGRIRAAHARPARARGGGVGRTPIYLG